MRSSTLIETATKAYSYLKPLTSLLFKAEAPVVEVAAKKHRSRSHFSANKTASLSIPEISRDRFKVVKPTAAPLTQSTYSINSLLSSFMSLWISSAPAPVAVPEKKHDDEETISAKIELLESSLKKSTDATQKDSLILQKVELVSEEIKEHAARRVDLFFYLLVAVHGKQITVTKESTVLQHGQGSDDKGTQACHSSLFPNVKFEKIPSAWSWISTTPCSTLDNTQFKETLNMTVELPDIVNIFDACIEGRYHRTRYIKDLLTTLNKASRNEIDPIQGMNEFFKIMDSFFVATEKKYQDTKKLENPTAFKKVMSLQKEGTFQGVKKDTLLVDDSYLSLMLRLKPHEAAIARYSTKYFASSFTAIQNEIFASTLKEPTPSLKI